MAETEKIQANLIIEILGRPASHIKDALEQLIKRLGSEKGVRITESRVHEPKLAKDSKDVYTTFAEISVEFDDTINCLGVLFAYMPAHIEIISPEKFSLSNLEFNDLANKLLLRLHDYDAIAKKMIYENNILTQKLFEVAPHLFKKKEETIEEKLTKETKKTEIENKESQEKIEPKSKKEKKSKKSS